MVSDIVLNIGLLGPGDAAQSNRLSVVHRLAIWRHLISDTFEPGWLSEVRLVPNRVWGPEPVLIVQGSATRYFWNSVEDAIKETEQDCIAYYLLGDGGFFVGPRPYTEFDINHFHFIGDTHGKV